MHRLHKKLLELQRILRLRILLVIAFLHGTDDHVSVQDIRCSLLQFLRGQRTLIEGMLRDGLSGSGAILGDLIQGAVGPGALQLLIREPGVLHQVRLLLHEIQHSIQKVKDIDTGLGIQVRQVGSLAGQLTQAGAHHLAQSLGLFLFFISQNGSLALFAGRCQEIHILLAVRPGSGEDVRQQMREFPLGGLFLRAAHDRRIAGDIGIGQGGKGGQRIQILVAFLPGAMELIELLTLFLSIPIVIRIVRGLVALVRSKLIFAHFVDLRIDKGFHMIRICFHTQQLFQRISAVLVHIQLLFDISQVLEILPQGGLIELLLQEFRLKVHHRRKLLHAINIEFFILFYSIPKILLNITADALHDRQRLALVLLVGPLIGRSVLKGLLIVGILLVVILHLLPGLEQLGVFGAIFLVSDQLGIVRIKAQLIAQPGEEAGIHIFGCLRRRGFRGLTVFRGIRGLHKCRQLGQLLFVRNRLTQLDAVPPVVHGGADVAVFVGVDLAHLLGILTGG